MPLHNKVSRSIFKKQTEQGYAILQKIPLQKPPKGFFSSSYYPLSTIPNQLVFSPPELFMRSELRSKYVLLQLDGRSPLFILENNILRIFSLSSQSREVNSILSQSFLFESSLFLLDISGSFNFLSAARCFLTSSFT